MKVVIIILIIAMVLLSGFVSFEVIMQLLHGRKTVEEGAAVNASTISYAAQNGEALSGEEVSGEETIGAAENDEPESKSEEVKADTSKEPASNNGPAKETIKAKHDGKARKSEIDGVKAEVKKRTKYEPPRVETKNAGAGRKRKTAKKFKIVK